MPDNKKLSIGINVNTLVTALAGTIVSLLCWSNKQQLQEIRTAQDLAIIKAQDAVQTAADAKYETQQDSNAKYDTVQASIQRIWTATADTKKQITDDHAQTILSIQVLTDAINNNNKKQP